MLAFPSKDPNEVLDYVLDWSDRLETGDTISTSAWSLVTADNPDSVLVIDSDSNTTTTTTVWLSAGTVDKTYYLLNRVVTTGGRTMDQTVVLRVAAK